MSDVYIKAGKPLKGNECLIMISLFIAVSTYDKEKGIIHASSKKYAEKAVKWLKENGYPEATIAY